MSKNVIYSEKQRAFLRLWQKGRLRRINILVGSVRSGKTWISLIVWAFFVATSPKDGRYLMCAKTLAALKRNCLDLLQQMVGERNFKYSLAKKDAVLFGRTVYLEGANDARSESKIRGLSLNGAYCDEITLLTRDFFNMLLSRLSASDAKLIGTTNPDSPSHWLKKDFLDRAEELDLLEAKFLIDDNCFLDKAYVESLKKEYSGVFFDRFILGKWVAAEGAIYPQFAACPEAFEIEKENIPPLKYINIGVDFGGNKSNHAFVASGVTKDFDKLYVLKSESICAKGVSVAGMIGAFMRFVSDVEQKFGKADFVYADSAEQAIINEMRQKTDYSILNSIKNSIVNRIRCTDLLLSNKRIFLCKGENDALVSGLSDALWDEKSGMQDRRLDNGTTDIDILDAFEYSFEAFIKELLEG